MTRGTHGATSRQGKRGAVGKAKMSRGTTGAGANPNVRKKSKLVVTFDAEKRKEYLTGFHTRKQERRRFGLDMEAYKAKKRQLENKKKRRQEQKIKFATFNLLDDDQKNDEEDDQELDDSESDASITESQSVLGCDKVVTKVETFNDSFTQGKFGDVVTVTTSVGDLPSDSDDSGSDLEPSDGEEETDKPKLSSHLWRKKKNLEKDKHLTLFQRIQQQRKGKALPSKRSKRKDTRAARKAMTRKKGGQGRVNSGNKHGAEDGDGGRSAASKLSKKLKIKRQQAGGNKRQKKRSFA